MRHSTSSIADEFWYRGALSLLGALLGSSAAFLVGILLRYALHFSVDLSRIAIAGAAAGAFLGASLVALGLGIGGLIQKDRKKIFAILGTVFAAITFLGTILLMMVGLATG